LSALAAKAAGTSGIRGRLEVRNCLDDAARPAKDHNSDCIVNFVDRAQDSVATSGDMTAYADFAAVWLENTLWP